MRFPWLRVVSGGQGLNRIGILKAGGGKVRDGEAITYYGSGLTGTTSMTIGGIACTSFSVVNDGKIECVAPTDDLIHDVLYDAVIE